MAMGGAGIAQAQSLGSLTGSLGSAGQSEAPAKGAALGTVNGDRSVGCNVEWVSEVINSRTVQDNDYFKDHDGKEIASTGNGGYMSEVSQGFGGPGDVLFHHWISADNFHWRTPVATTVPIDDAVLTLKFEANTFTAAPTGSDVSDWFSTRETAFNMPDYNWDVTLPAPAVSGTAAEGFTLTYKLDDLDADDALGIQLVGPVAEGVNVQRGIATLTGTYPVGTESCTAIQGLIAGTPLGSLSGSLAGLGS